MGKNQAREASVRQKVLTDKGKEYEVTKVKKKEQNPSKVNGTVLATKL